MTLDELIVKSKEDLYLSNEIDKSAQDLPRRKAQWSEWISMFAVGYKKAEWALKKVKKEKFEHYYVNYTVTLDKADIRNFYLPGDDDVIQAEKVLEVWKQKLDLAERTLNGLNRMGFDIKNVIDYRKFMSGVI